jgi:hypothetical protein
VMSEDFPAAGHEPRAGKFIWWYTYIGNLYHVKQKTLPRREPPAAIAPK